MQTAFSNLIPIRGDLRVTVRHAASGTVKFTYEIRNTVMYSGLKSLVNLVAQKTTITPADYAIKYLRIGTGAVAPVRTDLDLTLPAPNAVTPHTLVLGDAEKFLTTVAPSFECKIITTLGTGDLNGLNLTEAGLFIRGTTVPTPPGSPPIYGGFYPELFARQIFPAIAKTIANVVDFDWRLNFTS